MRAFTQEVVVGLTQAIVKVLSCIIIRPTEGSLILIFLEPVMQCVSDEFRVL